MFSSSWCIYRVLYECGTNIGRDNSRMCGEIVIIIRASLNLVLEG